MKRQLIKSKKYSSNPGDAHLAVVLAKVDGYHPYVTWVYNKQDGGYFWGHYFETMVEAAKDFDKRGGF